MQTEKHHGLRRTSIRTLWIVFTLALAATLLADIFFAQYNTFGFEDSLGFYAGYGFVSCMLMVLIARLLGLLIKRPQDYYAEDADE